MPQQRLAHSPTAVDRLPAAAASHVEISIAPQTHHASSNRLREQRLGYPSFEALLRNRLVEQPWNSPPRKLRKMPKSSTLSLAMRGKPGKENASMPLSPKSPRSPHMPEEEFATPTAPFHNTPQSPASPKPRKDSKSIFSNFGATKSSSRLNTQESSTKPIPEQSQSSPGLYSNGRSGSSTPDLGRPVRTPNSDDNRSEVVRLDQRTESGMSNDSSTNDASKRKTDKSKKQGLLSRSRSIKENENPALRTRPNKGPPAQLSPEIAATWTMNGDGTSLKTAPMEKNQSWRQNMGIGKLRTHSADRHEGSKQGHRDEEHGPRRDRAEMSSLASNSYNESRGATLMSSLGSGARKMGEKMDSARKGVFGKLGRSSSNHESQTSTVNLNEPYVCKIIHRPLIEQTRLTRISTRLEQSRDKTEFWMPALPWRCIDYLNMRGCEEEGLYRVPGSAQQVRYYERKFDEDRDIDLISDPNLNDPNVIGSMFKNWLRQLPDEIFPKAVQASIQQACQGAKTTPQMLKDELSKLPPFNYYLLFAITCHISLLHSCSEFNKMNYNNLCICFQPAIKIDAFCFQFLILDWRNCWQGCWTEKDYLADELHYLGTDIDGVPQETSHRNGVVQTSNKSKPKESTSNGNHSQPQKSTLTENQEHSSIANQPKISNRAISSDRDGRATPPNPSVVLSEPPTTNKSTSRSRGGSSSERKGSLTDRGLTSSDRNVGSADRNISSSDSREGLQPRSTSTPKRTPPSVSIDKSIEPDDGPTPTQAQHSRDVSETTQFRLDLSNPPSSPFDIKF